MSEHTKERCRRIGTFTISDEHVLNGDIENAVKLFNILGCVPVRAEHLPWYREIQYTAFCEKFDQVSVGEAVPSYKIVVTQDEQGKITNVEAERQGG